MSFMNWTLEQAGLKNMGPKRIEKLRNAGIITLSQLYTANAPHLSRKAGISVNVIKNWQGQIQQDLAAADAKRQPDLVIEISPRPNHEG